MKKIFSKTLAFFTITVLLSGCARDLSSDMYTSDSTLSLTLEGVIVSARPVKIKESDKLDDNSKGMLAGGAMGAVLGSNVGHGKGNTAAMVGAGIAGAALGTVIEGKLKESKGYEYLVKVDPTAIKSDYYEGNAAMRNAIAAATTSGLITVVQAADKILGEGQRVYVIFSGNRTRVIPATNILPTNNYGNRSSNYYDNRPDNYNNGPSHYDNRSTPHYNGSNQNDYYDNRNNYENRSNNYNNRSDDYNHRAHNDYDQNGNRNENYDNRSAQNFNHW